MIRSFAIVSILLLIAFSCSKQVENEIDSDTKQGGTLHLNVPENIYSLIPEEISNESERFIASQMYETMIIEDGNDFILNKNILRSLSPISRDTLYYQLNSDLHFSNGTKIDSTSIDQWVNHLNNSGLDIFFDGKMNSLLIINSSIELTNSILSQANNYLFTVDASLPVGTGPFHLKSINEDISVDLTKNTYYPNHELPYLDALEIRMVKTKDTEVDEFVKGSLDLIKLDPLQRLQYTNTLSLDNHPNYQLSALDQKTYCFGLVWNMDSLEAYQVAKTLNNRPIVFDMSSQARALRFPNLSQAKIRESINVGLDNSVFSQLTLERLIEAGVPLNAGNSVESDSKYIHLIQGELDSNGNSSFERLEKALNSADYLIILNSWSGLAVYQYYLKSEDQIDRAMIDLKSVYFKAPINLE